MKTPPTIEPAPSQGPDYDPMDRLVEDLQNIQSFLSRLADNPKDAHYLKTHYSHILPLRKSIYLQIELLAEDPYNYSHEKIALLKKENEQIFSHLEGVIGSQEHQAEFKKFIKACEKSLSLFDSHLTP